MRVQKVKKYMNALANWLEYDWHKYDCINMSEKYVWKYAVSRIMAPTNWNVSTVTIMLWTYFQRGVGETAGEGTVPAASHGGEDGRGPGRSRSSGHHTETAWRGS